MKFIDITMRAGALSIWGTVNLVKALAAKNAAFLMQVTSAVSLTA